MILHNIETGEGPAVVLLHGLFGRAQNLAPIARRFAPRARVISIDLRNHGASPHAHGMDYITQAGDVLETLDALNALPARLLGHSMGGKAAMAAALLAPARIERLLVADIAPVAYSHHNAAIAAAMQALPLTTDLTRAQASARLEAAVPDPAIRGFLLQSLQFGTAPAWRIGLAEIAGAISDIQGWPALGARAVYDKPTLFVAGGASDYIQASYRPVIAALFPLAEVVTLENAGHWLHAEQPEAFGAIAERFLLGTEGSASF